MDPRFVALAALPDDAIDLAYGAFLIAAIARPQLDIPAYLTRLDDLGRAATLRVRGDWAEQVAALNSFLFDEMGFTGNTDDYFDPENSFLDQVLDRRMGIPITLSVVYMEVARRVGLIFQGVGFPSHFLVKLPVEQGEIVVDPFHRGLPLSAEQLEERLRAAYPEGPRPSLVRALQTVGRRAILARMLRNLKTLYQQSEEWEKALAICDPLLLLEPENPVGLRDRGAIYWHLECFRPAYADLSRYLELVPDAEDGDELREKLVDLQALVARLN
jgi:regulator of sirC expression with transglutaminase-like and TPR domain